MSEASPRLSLPYIQPSQNQKHVTHNAAIAQLDILVQLAVESRSLGLPPVTPAAADRYIVASAATGAWDGQDGRLAIWEEGAWTFVDPRPGWLAWVIDEATLVVREGTLWTTAGAGGGAGAGAGSLDSLGLNASADATNRLTVAAPATLLTHEGAGHQLKINKAGPAETASLLFQSDWSGRAEIGLAGTDAFSVKVSADGVTWTEALYLDPASTCAGLWTTAPTAPLHINGALRVGGYTLATLPSANSLGAGAVIYVADASGGAVMAFSDGTNWRRMTDRGVVP